MRQYITQIILIIGLFLIFVSFLFFGRMADTYMLLLTVGILVSLITFLIILFGKKPIKAKIKWTLIVVLTAVIHHFSEPYLIKSSFSIYISSNDEELNMINEILLKHDSDITIYPDTVKAQYDLLSVQEIDELKNLRKEVGAYIISKSASGIYYGLYGFLDVRIGVDYILNSDVISHKPFLTHIKDNWYY